MSEKFNDYCFKFSWIIDNFSMLPNKPLRSPAFTAENMNRTKWYIEIYPGGLQYTQRNLRYLIIADSLKEPLEINFKIDIEDEKGRILASEKIIPSFKTKGADGFSKFMSNVDVLAYNPLKIDSLTVRCFMKRKQVKNINFIECVSQTKVSLNRTCFKWIINGFNSASLTEKKILFYSREEHHFDIYINSCEYEDEVKIYIKQILSYHESFDVLKGRISVLNDDSAEEISNHGIYWYDKDHIIWEFPLLLKKSSYKINKNKNTSYFSIQILCDFSLPSKNIFSEISYNIFDSLETVELAFNNGETINTNDVSVQTNFLNDTTNDLRALLDNNILTDVKLKLGNELFPAHKIILSARSQVFYSMFQNNFSESETGIVEIEDLDSMTVKDLLKFLYTGELDTTDVEVALKLLLAAEKYQVVSLKRMCTSSILPAINVKNVGEVLLVADLISEEFLKTAAIDYIKDHASEVLSSEEWLDCAEKNVRLTTKITSQLIAHLSKEK